MEHGYKEPLEIMIQVQKSVRMFFDFPWHPTPLHGRKGGLCEWPPSYEPSVLYVRSTSLS